MDLFSTKSLVRGLSEWTPVPVLPEVDFFWYLSFWSVVVGVQLNGGSLLRNCLCFLSYKFYMRKFFIHDNCIILNLLFNMIYVQNIFPG